MAERDSHLRVFLSADLVGSTKLKNDLNQQSLWEKFEARQGLIQRLRSLQPDVQLNDVATQRAVLQSLGIGEEDFDWATVVGSFYHGFHNQFAAELKDSKNKHSEIDEDCRPWKAIGDELLYQFPVKNRRQLFWIVVSFLKAIRRSDKTFQEKDQSNRRGLRLKGTAWVAGFPVRNRVIELPALESTEDFLGPDIDTGFRIGKCTRPGMMVVSVELAELLSETPDLDPFLGMIVGWEGLKGVWNDRLYPVVWVELPEGMRQDNPDLEAQPFNDWQQQECRFCRDWAKTATKNQLRQFAKRLRDLRDQLHPNLGLVDPYITGDTEAGDKMPPQHQQILELQKKIEQFLKEAEQQDANEDGTRPVISEVKVEELVSEVLKEESTADEPKKEP